MKMTKNKVEKGDLLMNVQSLQIYFLSMSTNKFVSSTTILYLIKY